jgi:hypothetical protein
MLRIGCPAIPSSSLAFRHAIEDMISWLEIKTSDRSHGRSLFTAGLNAEYEPPQVTLHRVFFGMMPITLSPRSIF